MSVPLHIKIFLKGEFKNRFELEKLYADYKESDHSVPEMRFIENRQAQEKLHWAVYAKLMRSISYFEKRLSGKDFKEDDFVAGYGADYIQELVSGLSQTDSSILGSNFELNAINSETGKAQKVVRASEEVSLELLKDFLEECYEDLRSGTLVIQDVPARER